MYNIIGDQNKSAKFPEIEKILREIHKKKAKGLLYEDSVSSEDSKFQVDKSCPPDENLNYFHKDSLPLYEILELLKSLLKMIREQKANTNLFSHPLNEKLPTSISLVYKDIIMNISFVNLASDSPIVCFVISDLTEKALLINIDDKNQFKNELLKSINHELRTPLNFMYSTITFLYEDFIEYKNKFSSLIANYTNTGGNSRRNGKSSQRGEKHDNEKNIEDIKKWFYLSGNACDNNIKTIKHILLTLQGYSDFGNMDTGRFDLHIMNIDLMSAITDLISIYSSQLETKKLTYELNFCEKLLSMQTDGKIIWSTDLTKFNTLFSNIFLNAIKYAKNSMIQIMVNLVNIDVLSIGIKDHGMGISESNLTKLDCSFKNLWTPIKTDNCSGIGLGLRIAACMQRYLGSKENNQIDIQSQLNVGTTLTFYLHFLSDDFIITQGKANSINDEEDVDSRSIDLALRYIQSKNITQTKQHHDDRSDNISIRSIEGIISNYKNSPRYKVSPVSIRSPRVVKTMTSRGNTMLNQLICPSNFSNTNTKPIKPLVKKTNLRINPPKIPSEFLKGNTLEFGGLENIQEESFDAEPSVCDKYNRL